MGLPGDASGPGAVDEIPTRRSFVARAARARAAFHRVSRSFSGVGRRLALLSAVSVVAGIAEAALFALVAAISVSLSQGSGVASLTWGASDAEIALGPAFVVALALTLVRAGMQLWLSYLPARLSADAVTTLRHRLFAAFSDASWEIKSREREGGFQTLMTANAEAASLAVVGLGRAIAWGLLFVSLLATAIVISAVAALVLAIAAVVLLLALLPLGKIIRRNSEAVSAKNVDYAGSIQEVAVLAEELEAFGPSPSFRDGLDQRTDALRHHLLVARFLGNGVGTVFQSVALLLLVAALAVVWALDVGDLASLAAVVLILVRSLSYGQQLQTSLNMVDQQLPYLTQLETAIDHYEAHHEQDGSEPLHGIGRIGLESVQFAYTPERQVLDEVTFEVGSGEVVGIVGPSGAGKSTITQMLLRLRRPDAGLVTVDGRDAAQFRRADWRRRVAYVPQTPQLVWGSVAENIRFFRDDITDEALRDAARRAGLHDEIVGLPDGYATRLGQRSSGLSGGQRQRLCLARALAADPDVLVLDEPTSSLDVRAEVLVQETIASLRPGVIVFLVAHRLSTLSVCDRVMVVVDGRVQDFDTVDRLQLQNSFFGEVSEITRAQTL
ncbi:ABC transporter ATP-binding protein [Luteimicrobium subarcticum]|uniref:ATP-binding cassette subfamily B protein n=1 Tax=Luteimicrobium subarcticum TaxID=620910 RepID=A0A2M8WUU2_9MICO|nr:ABC transporter ATP-binding protein [Luteimicrobium subarcticum]PJI94717.1 ATP-binding cassette subfamily B protein [Luteimicrobium subarcticum]